MPDAVASGILYPLYRIFDGCAAILNKILSEIQLYLTSISALEGRIVPVKRSIYAADPRRGFRFLRRKISSPGEAYGAARNFVKYRRLKGGGVCGWTGTGAFS
jgi:hypothetical protein